jgi:hypothetical protein
MDRPLSLAYIKKVLLINQRPRSLRSSAVVGWRVGCTVVSIVVVQAAVCGIAALPVVVFWLTAWMPSNLLVRAALFSVLLVPSYLAFAVCLMAVSAAANRVTGARTPPDATMPIAEMGWPLMHLGALHGGFARRARRGRRDLLRLSDLDRLSPPQRRKSRETCVRELSVRQRP